MKIYDLEPKLRTELPALAEMGSNTADNNNCYGNENEDCQSLSEKVRYYTSIGKSSVK